MRKWQWPQKEKTGRAWEEDEDEKFLSGQVLGTVMSWNNFSFCFWKTRKCISLIFLFLFFSFWLANDREKDVCSSVHWQVTWVKSFANNHQVWTFNFVIFFLDTAFLIVTIKSG